MRRLAAWITRPLETDELEDVTIVLVPIALAYVMGALVLLLTGSPGGSLF